MEGWKFWWGIAAFFLGGLATQLTGWLTYRRQRADKAAEAADVARSRRDEFELRHLLEVAQLLHDYINASVHTVTYWEASEHHESLLSDLTAATERFNAAEAALESRVGFILSDQIRALVRRAIDAIEDAHDGRLAGDDHPGLRSSNGATRAAFTAISKRVRELYTNPAGPGQGPSA